MGIRILNKPKKRGRPRKNKNPILGFFSLHKRVTFTQKVRRGRPSKRSDLSYSLKETLFILLIVLGLFSIAGALTRPEQVPSTPSVHLPSPKIASKVQAESATSSATKISTASAVSDIITPINTGVRIPIMTYHYIGTNPNPADKARYSLSVTTEMLDAHLNYLTEHGFTFITMPELYAIFNKQMAPPAKPIMLTFDDGYIDFYINAFPVLQKYHAKAVSFIPTGLIGGNYYMSWDQVRQLTNSGLVDIEDHTVSHPSLPSLSDQKITEELKNSKLTLEQEIGHPVNFLAYPFGSTNTKVMEIAKTLGYIGGVGTWYGIASTPGLDMPRIRVAGTSTLDNFVNSLPFK